MDDMTMNDLEVASNEVIMQTARVFAETLAGSDQFNEFEQSYDSYRQDMDAQSAFREYQLKRVELQTKSRSGSLDDKDREVLFLLQTKALSQPSFVRYGKAQESLVEMCQKIGDLLSKTIDLDYSDACKISSGGCCG